MSNYLHNKRIDFYTTYDTDITGAECVNIAYPGFYDDLAGLEH